MMHDEYMAKTSAITLRVPSHIKKALRVRAARAHRSLSAEALAVIEGSLGTDGASSAGHFLGRFVGSRVVTDAELREVREDLWGGLTRSRP
jgi:hypothetical protein